MKKQKAAVLDSSLLVRKGEAAPSVFSAAEPARPAWPVEPEPSAAAGPGTTSDTPVPTAAERAAPSVDTTGVDTTGADTTGVDTTGVDTTGVDTTGADTTAAAKAANDVDATAAMERIRKAMTRGPAVPFSQRGATANDPIDLAAVKQARAEGGLANGTAVAGRFVSRRSRTSKRRVALTLRVEPERHLRLKIFAANAECSIQSVLSCALDDYFERFGATVDGAGLGVHQAPGTRYGGKE